MAALDLAQDLKAEVYSTLNAAIGSSKLALRAG